MLAHVAQVIRDRDAKDTVRTRGVLAAAIALAEDSHMVPRLGSHLQGEPIDIKWCGRLVRIELKSKMNIFLP